MSLFPLEENLMHKKFLSKLVIYNLCLSLLVMPIYAQNARAEVISTEMMLQIEQMQHTRSRVEAFFARSDVQKQLAMFNVNTKEASSRMQALSDQEVLQLASVIDQAPAGADGAGALIGAVIFVFVLLLITDVLGLTKVFPFTRSAR